MENLKDLDLEIASFFLGGESISTTGDTPRNRMTKKMFEEYRRKLEEIGFNDIHELGPYTARLLKTKDIRYFAPFFFTDSTYKGHVILAGDITDGAKEIEEMKKMFQYIIGKPNNLLIVGNAATPFGMWNILDTSRQYGIDTKFYINEIIGEKVEDGSPAYGLDKNGHILY